MMYTYSNTFLLQVQGEDGGDEAIIHSLADVGGAHFSGEP